MRFSLAIVVAVAGAAIEARPNTESTEVAEVDTTIESNIEARGLFSNIFGGLGSHSSSSSATPASSSPSSSSTSFSSTTPASTSSSSSVSTSSSTPISSSTSIASSKASITSSTSTSTPASSATNDAPAGAKVKTYGNDVITEINTAGSTGDRRGFKWTPVDSSE